MARRTNKRKVNKALNNVMDSLEKNFKKVAKGINKK